MKVSRYGFGDSGNYFYKEDVECSSIENYLRGQEMVTTPDGKGKTCHFDDKLVGTGFHDVFRMEVDLGNGAVTGADYIGHRISKVPENMLGMFGYVFNLYQTGLILSGTVGNKGSLNFGPMDEFGELQLEFSPNVTIKEDPSDTGYIVFDFRSLGIARVNAELGKNIVTRVSKVDFWGNDFAKKYPDMKYFKMAVVSAIKTFEKRGISSDDISYVLIDCEAYLNIDFNKISDYTVMEGISLAYENPYMCEGRKEGYGVAYVLGADYRKNAILG